MLPSVWNCISDSGPSSSEAWRAPDQPGLAGIEFDK
jgi:hypothetical protein